MFERINNKAGKRKWSQLDRWITTKESMKSWTGWDRCWSIELKIENEVKKGQKKLDFGLEAEVNDDDDDDWGISVWNEREMCEIAKRGEKDEGEWGQRILWENDWNQTVWTKQASDTHNHYFKPTDDSANR